MADRHTMDSNKSCGVGTLDVRNAFNSAIWGKKIVALVKLGAPKYLGIGLRVGRWNYDVWIIIYGGISTLQLPEVVAVIRFANDADNDYRNTRYCKCRGPHKRGNFAKQILARSRWSGARRA